MYSNRYNPLHWHRNVDFVSSLGSTGGCGNKEATEDVVVTSAMNGYDLQCIAEDITWGVALNDIPVISVSNLLSLLIIQIHCNFI